MLVADDPLTQVLGIEFLIHVHPVLHHIVGDSADCLIDYEQPGSIRTGPTLWR